MIIVFVVAGIAMVISFIVERIRHKERTNEIDQLLSAQFIPYATHFSVSDYLERIEKAGIEIAHERDKQTKYQLVLWLVVEGIRLNDDGTTEWIQREEEKPKPVSVSYSPTQRLDFNVMQSPQSAIQAMYNAACQTPGNQMQLLQAQLQNCYIQHQMQMQYSQIMNALHPLPYPQYPYGSFCLYQNLEQQCCNQSTF